MEPFEFGDFESLCPVPDVFLVGTLRVEVRCRETDRPVPGVRVLAGVSREDVLGRR